MLSSDPFIYIALDIGTTKSVRLWQCSYLNVLLLFSLIFLSFLKEIPFYIDRMCLSGYVRAQFIFFYIRSTFTGMQAEPTASKTSENEITEKGGGGFLFPFFLTRRNSICTNFCLGQRGRNEVCASPSINVLIRSSDDGGGLPYHPSLPRPFLTPAMLFLLLCSALYFL